MNFLNKLILIFLVLQVTSCQNYKSQDVEDYFYIMKTNRGVNCFGIVDCSHSFNKDKGDEYIGKISILSNKRLFIELTKENEGILQYVTKSQKEGVLNFSYLIEQEEFNNKAPKKRFKIGENDFLINLKYNLLSKFDLKEIKKEDEYLVQDIKINFKEVL